MTTLDVPWAINALREFLNATDQVAYDNSGSGVVVIGTHQRVPDSEAAEYAYVAERILDHVLPKWRAAEDKTDLKGKVRWRHLRDWSARGIASLEREAELREKLGDNAPTISASGLHPWVWNGASSLWQSGHYRQAVEDALKKVNAETQNKISRRDVSESDLFNQAFSDSAPAPGKPRLRRMVPDGSDTYKSMQRGARSLAEGIYAGIRNPFGHGDPSAMDIDEQVGLEYLAGVSVLARWVDDATVESAS